MARNIIYFLLFAFLFNACSSTENKQNATEFSAASPELMIEGKLVAVDQFSEEGLWIHLTDASGKDHYFDFFKADNPVSFEQFPTSAKNQLIQIFFKKNKTAVVLALNEVGKETPTDRSDFGKVKVEKIQGEIIKIEANEFDVSLTVQQNNGATQVFQAEQELFKNPTDTYTGKKIELIYTELEAVLVTDFKVKN